MVKPSKCVPCEIALDSPVTCPLTIRKYSYAAPLGKKQTLGGIEQTLQGSFNSGENNKQRLWWESMKLPLTLTEEKRKLLSYESWCLELKEMLRAKKPQ